MVDARDAVNAPRADSGLAIATGIIDTLRGERIMLPAPAVIERTRLAGRARARKRIAHTLIAGLEPEQRERLDTLLVVDPDRGVTPLGGNPFARLAEGALMPWSPASVPIDRPDSSPR